MRLGPNISNKIVINDLGLVKHVKGFVIYKSIS